MNNSAESLAQSEEGLSAPRTPAPADHSRISPNESTTAQQTASRVEVPSTPPLRSQPWHLPPRYLLRGPLARGGMGLVLRVHDVEVDRPLAVKLLLDPHAAGMAERFLDEARITGQLQHPGIPPVHEIGQLSDGRPFFSMKLIAGRTLDELLRERPHPSSDLPSFLHIFEQIAQTVAYAHAQGVIHRDLKPLNVMVGAFGEVQVMDWGLAKRLSEDAVNTHAAGNAAVGETATDHAAGLGATVDYRPDAGEERTQAGQVMGTFAYMPPEQARGEVGRLDERSDVFGLGAILCQILTGEPPYRSTEKNDLWQQARRGDLSDAWARLETCGADAELIALTRRFLAAEPEQRPRHAGVAAEQITAYLRSVQQRLEQAERERAVAQARTLEERRRRRWQLALAASLLLALLGGGAAGMWYYQDRAARAAEEARQQTELASRKARLDQDVTAALDEAQRLHDELYTQLADARAASVLLSDIDGWQSRVQAARSRWQRAERLAAVDPTLLDVSVADRLQSIGRQLDEDDSDWKLVKQSDALRLGEVVVADDYLRDQATGTRFATFFRDELKLDVMGGDAEHVAEQVRQSRLCQVVLALLDHWAKIATDGKQIRRLSAVARLANPDPWRDRVRDPETWKDRARLEQLSRQADVSQQPPHILLLLAKRLRNRGGNDTYLLQAALAENPRDFWLYKTLAQNSTNATEKIGYLQAALAVRPQSFEIHENLAMVLSDKKHDRKGAIRHHRLALKFNPRYSRAHFNLSLSLLAEGDLDGAIYHSQKAMEINWRFASCAHCVIGEALGKKGDEKKAVEHLLLAEAAAGETYTLGMLGSTWLQLGKWEKAVAAYRKLTTLQPRDAHHHVNLGHALCRQQKWEEAIAAFRKAIELDPADALAYFNLGCALQSEKKLDEAVAAYRKAIALDPRKALAYFNLGCALQSQKKLDEAVAAYRKAIELQTTDADVYVNLGHILQHQHKLVEAIAAYRKAIELEPHEASNYLILADALHEANELDKAVAAYRKTIEIDAGHVRAHNNLAVVLREQKRYREASAVQEKLLGIVPPPMVPICRYFAACNAILASFGKGVDANKLNATERSRLRAHALSLLQEEVRLTRQLIQKDTPDSRRIELLSEWQTDEDLALVREPKELAKLTEAERQAWQRLWADVKELLQQAPPTTTDKAP